MIEPVSEEQLPIAADVHARAWRDSHRAICSPQFVRDHTAVRQLGYLRDQVAQGKQLYMLTDGVPVGIVTVIGDLVENLYVVPELQDRGYGTQLLRFAMAKCDGAPRLWVLESNVRARALYERIGFRETGVTKPFTDRIIQYEMRYDGPCG